VLQKIDDLRGRQLGREKRIGFIVPKRGAINAVQADRSASARIAIASVTVSAFESVAVG